jgi:tRNA(Ile)-lysidine synthase
VTEKDFPICIRNVKPGDKIEMRFGTKSLSRFFIDRKINRIDRKHWLVMENQAGKVIFVPGLGCDVEHFSVKANLFMIQ